MERRKFLRTSAIGFLAPVTIFGDSSVKVNKNNPIILSTWSHGIPANEAAWKILQNNGSHANSITHPKCTVITHACTDPKLTL